MTDREKYYPYLGKVISWKILQELGVIAEIPPLPVRAQTSAAARRTCDECTDWHYARGKCRKHYLSERRASGKTQCHECASTETAVFWQWQKDNEVYCGDCVGKKAPLIPTEWVKL